MPSKNGFGNSRTPMKKVGYGSAMHYKNPIMMTAAQETLPENLKAGIRAKEAKDSTMKMYGKSPVKKDTGEVVSKNSPGKGYTKTKGTNIWAPPVADKEMFGRKEALLMKDSTKKVAKPGRKSTITNNKSMKPPYKKPVGPRA